MVKYRNWEPVNFMNILKNILRIVIFVVIAILSCFAPFGVNAQSGSVSKATHINSEIPTNGIYGVVSVVREDDPNGFPTIDVSVVDTNTNGFYVKKDLNKSEASVVLEKLFSGGWVYFKATNLFCGPIELTDANGKKVVAKRADVCSPDSYPAFFSLSAAKSGNSNSVALFPVPLNSSRDNLARFQIENYFDITEPGEYRLTVWPKIYRISDTNSDICERIDLPPVEIPVKLGDG